MAPLVIPDPALILLVGAAGSAKSTLAARLFAPDEILSSDALRGVVSGDESDQAATRVAFSILHRSLDRRLRAGQLTVIDATNAAAVHRGPLLRRARAVGMPVVALVLDLPAVVVHGQNAGRARVVDPAVVDRHLGAIRLTVDGGHLVTEGFDQVVILRTPEELAAVEIERLPRT